MINVGFSGFTYELRPYGNKHSERVRKELGVEAYFVGQDLKCLFSALSLRAKIVTDDGLKSALLIKFNAILNEFYPASNLCKVDIKSGEMIERDYLIKPVDPIITNWLNASDAHWWSICDWKKLIGVKPFT